MTDTAVRKPVPRGGALDALRFVAAMFVVVFHFGDEAPVALRALHPFLERGYLATDFFLILSGFVLARAYGAGVLSGRIGFGRFWTKRLARCYPTHIITLGLLAAMVGVAALAGVAPSDPERYRWADLPAQIFLLHAFGWGGGQWNVPSWTISTLLICYAAFPLLWSAMTRLPGRLAAVGLGLAILFGAQALSQALLGQDQANLGMQWSLARAAPLFLIGLALGRAVEAGPWSPALARAVGFGGAAVLLANAAAGGPDLLNLSAIGAIILGCGASPVTRALPGAAWGAQVSFSLFMVHTMTGAIWFSAVLPILGRIAPRLTEAPIAAWTLWAGGLAFTVVAAGLYDRFVDAPIQKALNRRFFAGPAAVRPRPAPRPAPAPNA